MNGDQFQHSHVLFPLSSSFSVAVGFFHFVHLRRLQRVQCLGAYGHSVCAMERAAKQFQHDGIPVAPVNIRKRHKNALRRLDEPLEI